MKINEIGIGQAIIPDTSKKTGNAKADTGFEEILKQQIKSVRTNSVMPSGQAQSPMTIPSSNLSEQEMASVHSTDQILNELEHYSQLLGDGGSNLRTVAPVVKRMGMQLSELDRICGQLPMESPIRELVDETRALVRAEVDRFDSGHYVDP